MSINLKVCNNITEWLFCNLQKDNYDKAKAYLIGSPLV